MGKARKIAIDTITFEKFGDAKKFFQAMLQRYKNGERVSDQDESHLRALLKRHDDQAEKEGVGIAHFYVDTAPEYATRCFWIFRTDETRTDISFMHCLEEKSGD